MKKQNKNISALYCLVVMLTIWCTWNTARSGNIFEVVRKTTTDLNLFERQVSSLIDRADALEQKDIQGILEELPVLKEDKEEANDE